MSWPPLSTTIDDIGGLKFMAFTPDVPVSYFVTNFFETYRNYYACAGIFEGIWVALLNE
jgi:hypothetical protein